MVEARGVIMMYILLNGITSLQNFMKVKPIGSKVIIGRRALKDRETDRMVIS
jgi:hypothetical protein